ncbi:MAG TPA: fibronectin type III domain-containing protein [Solirubrobacterales bacterium]|nr:fibronectin type III domain-containing protein [Solirubrobacterales bacterium]
MLLTVACVAVGIATVAAPAFALSPSVETLPASAIGETTATLNGKVNPNGLETKYFFEYGTTTSYGTKTAEVSAGSGSTALEKSQSISGLKANTTYHYRIVAINSSGTSQGADRTFNTISPPGVLTVNPETKASGEEAILKGLVTPGGQTTTFQFEYGTVSGAYTTKVPISPEMVSGTGVAPVSVSAKVTGLTPGTKYFYRVTASNASGEKVGNQVAFLSSKAPGIKVLPISEVTPHEAKASVIIEPHGLATTSYLEIGTTTSYGLGYALKEVSGAAESSTLTHTFSGLEPNTVYHYRLVAENSAGKVTSSDQTFTTLDTITLWSWGEQLKGGAPLTALGDISFQGSTGNRFCDEAELSGELKQNPGATQAVTTLRMQDEKSLGCLWKTYEYNFSVRYAAPASGITIYYWPNGAGKGVVRVPKFEFVQTVYLSGGKIAVCKYDLELTGSFYTESPLVTGLSGHTEPTEASPVWCPSDEDVYLPVAVTSNGKTVEALP